MVPFNVLLCCPSSSPSLLTLSSHVLHCLCSGHTSYFSDLWEHLLPWVAPCSNLSSSIPALHEATIVCVISYGPSALPEPEETPAFCYPHRSPSCSYPYGCFPSLCGYALVYQLLLFQHNPNQHGEYMPLLQPPFPSWFKAWHQIPEGFSHPAGVPPCIKRSVSVEAPSCSSTPALPMAPSLGLAAPPSLPAHTPTPAAGHEDTSTADP